MKLAVFILGLTALVFNPAYAQHEGHNVNAEKSAEDRFCPVCGPEEEMEALSFSYKHEGKKYHFCSLDCMKAFKKNPEKYLAAKTVEKTK
jgi:YHS domain-containing protein